MSDEIRVITNNVPRDVVEAYELTPAEWAEFDYYDWTDTGPIQRLESSPTFFRYRGDLYDLGEFVTTSGLPQFNPLRRWDGYQSDSFFSGLVVRYVGDSCEQVIVGRYLA